jgi:hypothetical protein
MGFDEIGQNGGLSGRFVAEKLCAVSEIEVPSWQDFVRIQGDLIAIREYIRDFRRKARKRLWKLFIMARKR